MITLEDMKKELMENPEFVKEYEAIQPEMNSIRTMIDAQHPTHKERSL